MIRHKLLIVDDEIPFTQDLSKLLSRRGYEVLTVTDGVSALRILQEDKFDVILLDIRMPGMDGRQVLKRIKAHDPDAEVIIMTGHGDMEMVIECLHLQASAFLTKPFAFELLLKYLTRSLGRAALKKRNERYWDKYKGSFERGKLGNRTGLPISRQTDREFCGRHCVRT